MLFGVRRCYLQWLMLEKRLRGSRKEELFFIATLIPAAFQPLAILLCPTLMLNSCTILKANYSMEWFKCWEQVLDFNLLATFPTVHLLGDHSLNFLFVKAFGRHSNIFYVVLFKLVSDQSSHLSNIINTGCGSSNFSFSCLSLTQGVIISLSNFNDSFVLEKCLGSHLRRMFQEILILGNSQQLSRHISSAQARIWPKE